MTDLDAKQNVIAEQLEPFRGALTGYCYRMLGSSFEAQDAVQETMVRAWRNIDQVQEQAAFKSWLYRIATNVCFDMTKAPQRRARPMELGPSKSAEIINLGEKLSTEMWIEPMPDSHLFSSFGDPAEQIVARESISLAFTAALQHLAPKQRAVLILCEVLRWKADEVAELLETTLASVNSALQRARATLATKQINETDPLEPLSEEQSALLARYLDAFERYDMDSLAQLLQEDCTLSMPPYALWMQGLGDVVKWMVGPGIGCEGSRMIPTVANGMPAFAQYRKSTKPGIKHEAWAMQVLEIRDNKIAGINAFLDVEHLYPLFGLPLTLS